MNRQLPKTFFVAVVALMASFTVRAQSMLDTLNIDRKHAVKVSVRHTYDRQRLAEVRAKHAVVRKKQAEVRAKHAVARKKRAEIQAKHAVVRKKLAEIRARYAGDREKLAEMQARYIAQELAFSDDITERFVDTYCRAQKEIWALGPRQPLQGKEQTERGSEQRVRQRFEMSEKILKIRRKYYGEYSKFLSQTQIEQVYKWEYKMAHQLAYRNEGTRPGSSGRK